MSFCVCVCVCVTELQLEIEKEAGERYIECACVLVHILCVSSSWKDPEAQTVPENTLGVPRILQRTVSMTAFLIYY